MKHELKILPEYFDAVVSGRKTFEIRKNDRDFHVGDILVLNEWDGKKYSGYAVKKVVAYMLDDTVCGIENGYVILGLSG